MAKLLVTHTLEHRPDRPTPAPPDLDPSERFGQLCDVTGDSASAVKYHVKFADRWKLADRELQARVQAKRR